MTDEEEKAVQEAAKGGQELIALSRDITAFLGRVFGPAAVEAGGMLHDWVRVKRLENLQRLKRRVEGILQQRGVSGRTVQVTLQFGVPLIESASLEDDDFIQEMWAGLLANAMDLSRQAQPRKTFVSLLSQLEPLDAQILNFLGHQGWDLFRIAGRGQGRALHPAHGPQGFSVSKLSSNFQALETEVKMSLLNLYRLGCVVDERDPAWDETATSGIAVDNPKAIFRPSRLGFALVEACSADDD